MMIRLFSIFAFWYFILSDTKRLDSQIMHCHGKYDNTDR